MKAIGHVVGCIGGFFLAIFIWPTLGVPALAIPILGWIVSICFFPFVWMCMWAVIYRVIVDHKFPWQN